MGCCSSPSPPPAPDYAGAAREQGAANAEAARIQGRINNPNYVNPYGRQTVTWDGDTPTVTQTLSPEQQAILDQQQRNELGLGDVAGQGIGVLGDVIGRNLDFSGAPRNRGAYGATPQGDVLDTSRLPAMPQGSEAMRERVIGAMMQRANKGFAERESGVNSDLVARGIAPGTEAYAREMRRIDEARNDARNMAETEAESLIQGAFGRDMGIREQAAQEQAQRFNQQGQNAELGMRGQAQGFGQQADLRRQAISELLAQRQTPLNEIIALMGGSQVNNPFAVGGYNGNANVAPAPIFGATQAQGQWDQNAYNQRVGSYNNMMGGLFGLGSAAVRGGF